MSFKISLPFVVFEFLTVIYPLLCILSKRAASRLVPFDLFVLSKLDSNVFETIVSGRNMPSSEFYLVFVERSS